MQGRIDQSTQASTPRFVTVINGVTFIDAIALEHSIETSVPTKHHLRQKMINLGVTFWDEENTVVKKPVVGIGAIGDFSVCLQGDLPDGTIKLYVGGAIIGPIKLTDCANGLRQTMGMQSSHTFMNPKNKTPDDLYHITTSHNHYSIAHGARLGFYLFGLSKVAEQELDVQRDLMYLARTTSARSICQDEPTQFALDELDFMMVKDIMKSSLNIREQYKTQIAARDKNKGESTSSREGLNSLFPARSCLSLGITADLRNLQKIVSDLSSNGKEQEYRRLLALMNDSLNNLFPELFNPTFSYGFSYPSEWQAKPPVRSNALNHGFFPMSAAPLTSSTAKSPKKAILLLGAPGVGKSTQTEHIMQQQPGVFCVSTGKLVRALEAKVAQKLPLTAFEEIAAHSLDKMREGKLMDDKPVYYLLISYLSPGGAGYEAYCKADTILLDGVIKAERNIEPFEEALSAFNKADKNTPMQLVTTINMVAPSEELIQRQQQRVATASSSCTPQRSDDNSSTYQYRLENYMNTIDKVLKYYSKATQLITVDSSLGVEKTTQHIIQAMNHAESIHDNTAVAATANI